LGFLAQPANGVGKLALALEDVGGILEHPGETGAFPLTALPRLPVGVDVRHARRSVRGQEPTPVPVARLLCFGGALNSG
jgi:hypothetical protein